MVGAGPGDAGLLTCRAKQLLEKADVIVYDALVGDAILLMMNPNATTIDVGKIAGYHKKNQDEINRILCEEAQKGHCVVRLKGGDPFLFGRGGEELELLVDKKIPFEVVPGVPSPVAVPAYAGIPVTHRDYSSAVHIITGHRKRGDSGSIDFHALAALHHTTLLFLMSIGKLEEISSGLVTAGMPASTPCAVLEKGCTAGARTLRSTLEHLARDARQVNIGTPGILLVGPVANLAARFHWADNRPLSGLRIWVTRSRAGVSKLSDPLRELGAEVLNLPAIEMRDVDASFTWNAAVQNIEEWEWLVFTSPNGVDAFWRHLKHVRFDIRRLGHCRIAAIGSGTANRLADYGVQCDYVPEKCATSAALADGLLPLLTKGKKHLLVAPTGVDNELTRASEAAGHELIKLMLYETKRSTKKAVVPVQAGDWITLTSASSAEGFAAQMAGQSLEGLRALCIGEKTAKRAQDFGLKTLISDEISIAGMVQTLIRLRSEELQGMRE